MGGAAGWEHWRSWRKGARDEELKNIGGELEAGEKELESKDEELERRSKRKRTELNLTLLSRLKGSLD